MKEQVMLGIDGQLEDLGRKGYVWQPKFDGNRGKAIYENDKVKIINRRGSDWADRLPELVEALLELAHTAGVKTFILDGEIVVFKDGHSNLRLSNTRCATEDRQKIRLLLRRTMPVEFMAFDVMEWNGTRFEHEPFHYRCKKLSSILQVSCPSKIRLTPTYEDAEECWQEWVVKRHEEGIMAKDPFSAYIYDRSNAWIKIKIRDRATVNICGYTKGEGRRADTFGALIMIDSQGRLKGRCGGGFTDAEAERILHVLKQAEPIPQPFPETEVGLPYTAIKTNLRLEVTYQMMNGDSGKMRSPRMTNWWMQE